MATYLMMHGTLTFVSWSVSYGFVFFTCVSYAEARNSYRLDVRPYADARNSYRLDVRPSVHQTLAPYQNG